eukprot:11037328-Lingulodinium_polyedra.AAC.1
MPPVLLLEREDPARAPSAPGPLSDAAGCSPAAALQGAVKALFIGHAVEVTALERHHAAPRAR